MDQHPCVRLTIHIQQQVCRNAYRDDCDDYLVLSGVPNGDANVLLSTAFALC